MKKYRIEWMITSLILVCAMAVNLTGCATKIYATDLMEGITANAVEPLEAPSAYDANVADFAVRLLQASQKEGENTLLSPLSVLCALSMTANGAEGETLEQMETVLGMPVEELNLYLYTYLQNLPQGEDYQLSLANSIWFADDDRFAVNRDFLQTNADYYGASIYQASFDDRTCKDINNWVKDKTDGMIPEILDQIPEDAIMYLVNALAFEAEWMKIYEKNHINDGTFTKEDGTEQNAEFMYSEESIYLEDANATGFMKKYKDGKYAFVAMLPNEGVSVSDYVASMTGEDLHGLLTNTQYATVRTVIPKFETEYNAEMSDILKDMGMPLAFDGENADFGKLGSSSDGNICIGRVLHKAFISVGEKGTKAGAATVVEMNDGSAMPVKPKTVYLDRPFVYMLVDCESNIPFFIGTMMDLG